MKKKLLFKVLILGNSTLYLEFVRLKRYRNFHKVFLLEKLRLCGKILLMLLSLQKQISIHIDVKRNRYLILINYNKVKRRKINSFTNSSLFIQIEIHSELPMILH